MKTQVNFTSFVQAFQDMNRFDQFGYDALKELFEHIENFEMETGEEVELDVIALCCEWSVMDRTEILMQYDLECDEDELEESVNEYWMNMSEDEFRDEVAAQLGAYCYDLPDGKFLVCEAMI